VPVCSDGRGDDDPWGPCRGSSQLLYRSPDRSCSPSLPQEKHSATRIVRPGTRKPTTYSSNRRHRKVRFQKQSPLSPQMPSSRSARQPQCSSRLVPVTMGRGTHLSFMHMNDCEPTRARPLGAGLSGPRVLPHALRKTEAGFRTLRIRRSRRLPAGRHTQSRRATWVTQSAERPVLR